MSILAKETHCDTFPFKRDHEFLVLGGLTTDHENKG